MESDDLSTIDLKGILELKNRVGNVPFPLLVKKATKFEVIPVDEENGEDKELIRHLRFALSSVVSMSEKAGSRFQGNRINDVGKKFEYEMQEKLRQTPIDVKKLGAQGYPDFRLKQGERVSYLELKLTSVEESEKSTFRAFFFSSGKKIESDARHLLAKVQMLEEANKYWKVLSWELRDLSKLEVRLKTEFQTGHAGMAKTPLLDSSSIKRGKDGQAKL